MKLLNLITEYDHENIFGSFKDWGDVFQYRKPDNEIIPVADETL